MKKIYLLASLVLTINAFAQTSCSVTITYTAPTCPTCCDGSASAQVSESCPPYTYTWSASGGAVLTPNPNVQSPTGLCAGTLCMVTIQDGGGTGCCGTMTGTVTIPSGTTGIEQVAISNSINIYPNPNNGSFVIEPQNTLYNVHCTVYDVNGKAVLTQTINGKTTIDANSLNEGVYNISLISNEGVVNKRLVIVR